MNMSDVCITLKNVGLSYKKSAPFGYKQTYYEALTSVTFDIYKGETIGIIGKNGAGKSTILRLLCGILEPDSGEIFRYCNKISLLSLQLGFDQELSGYDNAILSGMLLGYSKQFMIKEMPEIIQFSELKEFIHEPVKTYSSGMKARLGFSVANIASPDVLLIDEVLGVGDIDFRKKSEKAIKAKVKSNQTVVLVTHNGNQIKKLCDRAVWIEKGITKMVGSSREVVDAYESHK